jgi:hypothetical protein
MALLRQCLFELRNRQSSCDEHLPSFTGTLRPPTSPHGKVVEPSAPRFGAMAATQPEIAARAWGKARKGTA